MPVTRHFSPFQRNVVQKPASTQLLQTQSFCDWVSMYQTHDGGGLSRLHDGAFVRYDANGEHESTTLKKVRVQGSHETGIFVRCDGNTVWFEGNVSRFGRPDNVFGYTFEQCLLRINAILLSLSLPPFTPGSSFYVPCYGGDKPVYTGARITRLDLTQNYATGSRENAYAFMRHLSMQQVSRLKTGTYGEGETVDFGRGSRRVYSKAYLKHVELQRHMRKEKKVTPQNAQIMLDLISQGKLSSDISLPFDTYIFELAQWCASIGLVRFETTYKSTYLIDDHQNYLGGLNMPRLEKDFSRRQEVFTRSEFEIEDLPNLSPKLLAVYRMWQAGDDITSFFKKSQFYKYRSSLLPFGVDISVKSNVIQFQPRTRIVKLSSVSIPSFYQLPSPSFIRLAA